MLAPPFHLLNSALITRAPRVAAPMSAPRLAQKIGIAGKALKSGPYMYASNDCRCCRCRPSARHAERAGASASPVGFRCVVRLKKPGR